MRKLFAIIILIFTLIPLSATSLRVGFFDVPKEIIDDIVGSFELFLSSGFRSAKLDELCASRLTEKDKKDNELKIHEALSQEKTLSEKESFEYIEFDSIESVEIDNNNLRPSILNKNIDALNYLKSYYELDLIFVYSLAQDGALSFIELSLFDEDVKTLIDSVYLTVEKPSYYEDLLLSIGKIYYPNVAWIKEGETLTAVDSSLSEYKNKEVKLSSGVITVFEEEKIERKEHSQLLFSIPCDASLSVFAIQNSALPLWVKSSEPDLILSLSRDGFEGSVFQLDNSHDGVYALNLRPKWVKEDGVLKSAKDDFYRAFRDTFLAFSLYAISSSITNINSDIAPLGDIIKTATAGVSFVSLINLIKCCGTYYNRAKETYL